jgi:ketosteroid isomerase-like protein
MREGHHRPPGKMSTMQRTIVHVAVFAALAVVTTAFASAQTTAPTTVAEPQAVGDVRRLSTEEVTAFLNKDAKTMARLWSDDFVVTNPLNRFANKQQVLGMMDSGFLVITSYDRQIEYARLYRDDTVVLAGNETVVWGGRMPNAGRTERLRFTAIWMRQKSGWQEVARHANIVPAPQ